MHRMWGIGVACAALVGCSLSLDFTECRTDDDCTDSLVCTSDGYCATPASAYDGPQFHSLECEAVYGPVHSEDVLLIGTVLPLTGSSSDAGLQMEQAVIMAVEAFNADGGILPGGRALGVVLCDSGSDPSQGVKAAHHLVSLGVSAVVGPAVDAVALAVAEEVSPPNETLGKSGLLLMSPSATHPALSSAEAAGEDLVWRVTASAEVQMNAMRSMLGDPEAHGLPTPLESLVVLYNVSDTTLGPVLQELLFNSLTANPIPDLDPEKLVWIPYLPDVASGDWVHEPTRKLVLENPDVAVVLGGTETSQLVAWLEALWHSAPFGCDRPGERGWDDNPTDGQVDVGEVLANLRCTRLKSLEDPPHWLLTQGDMRAKLQTEIMGYSLYCETPSSDGSGECQEEIESFGIQEAFGRISGMTQSEGDGASLETFRIGFEGVHGVPVQSGSFASQAWDATHLLAFGLAAALGQEGAKLEASDVAKGLRLLQSGSVFDLSGESTQLSSALGTLAIDGEINLQGASGNLDFTAQGEPGTSAVHRWRPLNTPGEFLLSPVLNGDGTNASP